ncbi:hypothetical protein M5C90_15780 [Pseudomonas chlororaphis subsp. piscium]|nr:hypothetical protein M5C90_15780 [Pseudomonas chlororaphis subsp. piscium]
MSNHNAAAYAIDAVNRESTESDQRARAVAAALTIIEAKAAGGSDCNLKNEFFHLSEYADKIQAALKAK